MLATAFTPAKAQFSVAPPLRTIGAPPADALADRFACAPTKTLGAREHLFCEGDRASHVYRVEAGHVLIYRIVADGRRQVIDFAYPGDIVGLGSLGVHGYHAQATLKTVVRCLPMSILIELAGADPKVGSRLYEAVSGELMAARELLFTVSQRTASERMASFLLTLSQRASRLGERPNEIVLPMTRSDIADFLGLTIETVSRMFTRLRQEGVIDIEQCVLVTIRDLPRLKEIAAGATTAKH